MNIKINNKNVKLAFTFNSFEYMQELDISAFEEFETKPFKALSMCGTLLYGAVNNNPEVFISKADSQAYLEKISNEGKFTEFFTELMQLLENSSFFKSLQESK